MYTSEELQRALKAYRASLEERFGDRLLTVSLFGSRARGDARPDSDVDVFVCIRSATSPEETEAAGIAGDVAVKTGVWLSPVVYSKERFDKLLAMENPFARAVLREGVPV